MRLRLLLVGVLLVVLAIVLWPHRDHRTASTTTGPARPIARGALRATSPQALEPVAPDGEPAASNIETRVTSAPAVQSLTPSTTIVPQPAGRTLEAAKLPALQPTREPPPQQPAGKQLRVVR